MMRNNKGQALVEFIIIIPIFILIISAMVDFGNIIYQKYQLANHLDLVSDMYKNNELDKINICVSSIDARVNIEHDNKYTTIKLTKDVNVNTIILNNVIGKKYEVSVKKTIYDRE